jgi:hypothetical protein
LEAKLNPQACNQWKIISALQQKDKSSIFYGNKTTQNSAATRCISDGQSSITSRDQTSEGSQSGKYILAAIHCRAAASIAAGLAKINGKSARSISNNLLQCEENMMLSTEKSMKQWPDVLAACVEQGAEAASQQKKLSAFATSSARRRKKHEWAKSWRKHKVTHICKRWCKLCRNIIGTIFAKPEARSHNATANAAASIYEINVVRLLNHAHDCLLHTTAPRSRIIQKIAGVDKRCSSAEGKIVQKRRSPRRAELFWRQHWRVHDARHLWSPLCVWHTCCTISWPKVVLPSYDFSETKWSKEQILNPATWQEKWTHCKPTKQHFHWTSTNWFCNMKQHTRTHFASACQFIQRIVHV